MTQQLQFPIDKLISFKWKDVISLWRVSLKDSDLFLECSLIAANTEACYVCCENIITQLSSDNDVTLPDYVVPMKQKDE